MFSNSSSAQMTVVGEQGAIPALQALYQERKEAIQKRLAEFREVMQWKDEEVFAELAFCLLTPQSSDKVCWEPVPVLKNRTPSPRGKPPGVRPYFRSIRFSNSTAEYFVQSRSI